MYKIAILGCENSHANSFLKYIRDNEAYSDIETLGVYSIDREAAEKLSAEFGVKVMDAPDQFVGQLDGLIITARHGGYHYQFAKPYLSDCIPMFIDKPITVTEEDAIEFAKELKEKNIPVSGGSSLIYSKEICELRDKVKAGEGCKVLGGFMRAPVNLSNPHGDFYFYAQHLVSMMTEVFGMYPEAVYAHQNGEVVNCQVSYKEFDVNLSFVDGNYKYSAFISTADGCVGGEVSMDGIFEKEFEAFDQILRGKNAGESLNEFFAPVYIMNAIERSFKSGNRETINYKLI